MKILSKFKNKIGKFWWILILLALIPSFNRLIHKGFFPTQDYIYVARIFEMDKSLIDGQFPVRWVPDFRYGEPLFNFYAPLPYYAGSLVHAFNINFLDTAKVLFALGLILSFFSMYLLGKELWGKTGGLISAFIYLYAPYRALDIYVRGDLSESWVFIFFPLMFYASLKLSKKFSGKNFAILSLSLAGLFYTHNLMTMLIAPFFILWLVYLAWKEKKMSVFYTTVLSSVLGVGLAAGFMLPSFFEKSFIQTQHLTGMYFDFRGHFVELRQFFSTFWGYGASVWGGEDGMSFQLGVVQWITLGLVTLFSFFKRKELLKNKNAYLLGVLFSLFVFSLFMQHNKSTFIWLKIPMLQYVQFPWRFMAISVFFASVIIGSLATFLPKLRHFLLIIVVIAVISVTYNYFRPESYYDSSIDQHYTTDVFARDDKMPKDYLPTWTKKVIYPKITEPQLVEGEAKFSDYSTRSDSATFNMDVAKQSVIDVPLTYFPGWVVKLNGKKTALMDIPETGFIRFAAEPGEYKVSLSFENTPLRNVGNIMSFVSLLITFYLLFSKKPFLFLNSKKN